MVKTVSQIIQLPNSMVVTAMVAPIKLKIKELKLDRPRITANKSKEQLTDP